MGGVKVAFIISHPIQYYVPILTGLVERGNIDLKVFYTWGEQSINKFDPGFNRVVEWDVPLLEGYSYEFLNNTAQDPGTHHFNGIVNPDIIQRIEAYNPDKIVVFGWSFKSHLSVLKYFKGKVPIYFRGDSHLLTKQSKIKNLIRKLYLSWIYRNVDYPIAVGSNNKAYYKWAGFKEENIFFAPHAINESRFVVYADELKRKVADFKSELKIPEQHIVFLYTGKFEYRKNLQTLIQAKLNLKDQPCTLLMVGNGPDEEMLKNMASTDPNIRFVGFMNQSQMPMIYRSADVFVLPSVSETWGLGINEAMNCGLAIIASDKVGSAVDLITNNGYIFEAGNSDMLSVKMKELIQHNIILMEMKEKSIINIKDWSINKLVVNFENALLKNV